MPVRETVERMFETMRSLRIAGDVDALAEFFTDDATFRVLGVGPQVKGKPAIREAIRALIDDFQFLEFRPIETIIDGDRVAVRHALTVRYAKTGKTATTETSDFLTMRDGKIAAYVQHVDTAMVLEIAAA